MKLGVAEILKKVSEQKTKQEKINLLRQHDSSAIKTVLQYALDPNIKWMLPETKPPYKQNQLNDLEPILYNHARKLYLFVEGGNPNLKQNRREMLFVELLEQCDKEDAELLCAIKDKKIPYKGITYKLVKEAFPNILP